MRLIYPILYLVSNYLFRAPLHTCTCLRAMEGIKETIRHPINSGSNYYYSTRRGRATLQIILTIVVCFIDFNWKCLAIAIVVSCEDLVKYKDINFAFIVYICKYFLWPLSDTCMLHLAWKGHNSFLSYI